MGLPELLAPAGNLEKLKMAVLYGADAVYLGGENFSLRAGADNFSTAEMAEGIDFAHQRGVKVYAAVNIYAHNQDLPPLPEYLRQLENLGVDALIISDPGIFRLAREIVPGMDLHISTQANTTNWSSVLFWRELGAKRVVLARELDLAEISEIKSRCLSRGGEPELEAFVHGAMCVSYSGRCLLSNYLTGRDANQGDCAQPCRWKYFLMEEKRPGKFLPITEDNRGTYLINSKDLCLLPFLPQLISAGLDSLKIEGRMKSAYYVAAVVKVYREAIDAVQAGGERFATGLDAWMEELTKVSHRDYSTGFLLGKPTGLEHSCADSAYTSSFDFVGLVEDYDPAAAVVKIEQRNRFRLGESLEFLPPQGPPRQWQPAWMKNEQGEEITAAPHPQQKVTLPLPFAVPKNTLVRRRIAEVNADDQ